jgi:hypothetical protein
VEAVLFANMKLPLLPICLSFFASTSHAQNLIPCVENGLFGFCDEKGQLKIDRTFQKALAFREYLAPVVREDGYWWFINKKGFLMFNTRIYSDQNPPAPVNGLFEIRYFDPIFANVTEFYNKFGLPVKVEADARPVSDTLPYSMFSVSRATDLAKARLGTPYGVDKLDCSGFMRYIFEPFGIVLPYYASQMAEKGREISIREIQAGDLVFFGGNPGFEKNVNHVGMVISVEKGSFEFIHASTSKGVVINKSSDAYYKSRFLFARRIFG